MRRAFLLATAVSLGALVCPTSSWADQEPPVYGPVDANAPPAPEAVFVPKGIPNALVDAAAVASREHPLVQQALANRKARVAQLRGAKWQLYPSLSVEGLAVSQGNQIGA